MPVLTAEQAPTLIPLNLPDIERQSNDMLAKARAEAELVRAAAAKEGREAGFVEGLEQGRTQGAAERAREFNEALATLRAAADELLAAREQLSKQHTHDAVVLAAAIARRVTKRESAFDRKVLEGNLAAAMKLIVDRGEIRIAVNPSQAQALAEIASRLNLQSTQTKIQFTEDPEISPGGCKVFTRGGHVDADIDTQLDRIINELLPETA